MESEAKCVNCGIQALYWAVYKPYCSGTIPNLPVCSSVCCDQYVKRSSLVGGGFDIVDPEKVRKRSLSTQEGRSPSGERSLNAQEKDSQLIAEHLDLLREETKKQDRQSRILELAIATHQEVKDLRNLVCLFHQQVVRGLLTVDQGKKKDE